MQQPPQQPLVSVGICTRNRGHSILAAVDHILANSYTHFELFIIDQSTNNETASALAQCHDSRVHYVASTERGVSRARNVVLQQARGELVLMTDDDCYAPPDWIERMVDVFKRYPDAGVVFCNVVAAPHDFHAGYIPTVAYAHESEFTAVTPKLGFNLMGAGMAMKRDVVTRLGGFDPALGPGGIFCSAEDVDVAMRAILAGYSIVRTDATQIIHDGFRPHEQVRSLFIRNFIGVGGMMGKFVRSGVWPVCLIVLDYTFRHLGISLWSIIRVGTPRGFRQLVWFYRGFYHGLCTPVEARTKTFALSPQRAQKLHFLSVDV